MSIKTYSQPKVSCVLLTADRQHHTLRAVKSYLAQDYANKELVMLDTGSNLFWPPQVSDLILANAKPDGATIGKLRNNANLLTGGDIIAHFDSDDLSHPYRLAEQVALLQSSGAEAVGYHDMVFWETRRRIADSTTEPCEEAWLYQHGGERYALGTSLMYWRKTWERVKFPDTSKGEDTLWLREVKCKSVSSTTNPPQADPVMANWAQYFQPRMIAEIHGSNTSSRIHRDSDQFTRIPELDAYCREHMKL